MNHFLSFVLFSSAILIIPVTSEQCDAMSFCSGDQTCCRSPTGRWNCCPMAGGVCCDDRKHCCPHGSRCDKGGLKCLFVSGLTMEGLRTQPAKRIVKEIQDSTCPDETTKCPSGMTCCLTKDGKYGCCQESNGVCCKDHFHCCPNGFSCLMNLCFKQNIRFPLMKKIAATPIESAEAVGPDTSFAKPPLMMLLDGF